MGNEWRSCSLGDVIELKRGYDLPKLQRKNGQVPIISSSGVTDYHCLPMAKAPGVITGRYGTIGEVFYASEDYWPLNTTLYVKDFKGNYPKFIYYFLKTIPYAQYSDKAAVPGINRNHLHMASIFVPSEISEQKSIAEFLSSLDNKITLNRQLNQTLEHMAQALFKSWFVDFDPVIDNALAAGNPIPDDLQDRALLRQGIRQQQLAKADHKLLPENIHKLFPSEFELTESLGWVPKGWVISRLGDKVSVKRGGSPRPIQDFLSSEGLPWTKISDATASNTRFIKSTSQHIKLEGLSKTTLLKKGTLILSNSATPGLPKFLDLDACIHDGWLHFPEKEIISDLYLYQLFLVIREELIQQGNGSIFTNLKTDILKDHSMVIPSKAALDQFDKLMTGFHSKIYELSESTAALEQLRDTLLPKLISGELRIPEAQAQLEEALA